jgi:hypothetical protein
MLAESLTAQLTVADASISETVKALARCKLVQCGTRPWVDEVTFPGATRLESVPPDKALLRGTQLLLSSRGSNVPNGDTARAAIENHHVLA